MVYISLLFTYLLSDCHSEQVMHTFDLLFSPGAV